MKASEREFVKAALDIHQAARESYEVPEDLVHLFRIALRNLKGDTLRDESLHKEVVDAIFVNVHPGHLAAVKEHDAEVLSSLFEECLDLTRYIL